MAVQSQILELTEALQADGYGLGIELVGEPRLAESFRLLVPLPHWRGHYILGRDQRLADAHVQDRRAQLVWRGLSSRQGHFDIEVTLEVTLEDDEATFRMSLANHSPHVIEEVFTRRWVG